MIRLSKRLLASSQAENIAAGESLSANETLKTIKFGAVGKSGARKF